jgi:hypothetical protein
MDKILDWLSGFGRKFDVGLQGLGKELWKIGSFVCRLSMVFVFFWYLTESINTLLPHHAFLAVVVASTASSVLFVSLVIVVRQSRRCDAVPVVEGTKGGSVLPFLFMLSSLRWNSRIGCTATHSPVDYSGSRRTFCRKSVSISLEDGTT